MQNSNIKLLSEIFDDYELNAIYIALYKQWLRTCDDDGNAIDCSQSMVDTTNKLAKVFEKLKMINTL